VYVEARLGAIVLTVTSTTVNHSDRWILVGCHFLICLFKFKFDYLNINLIV
jgi:hypothetical protein